MIYVNSYNKLNRSLTKNNKQQMTLYNSQPNIESIVRSIPQFSTFSSNFQSPAWSTQIMQFTPFIGRRSEEQQSLENFYFKLLNVDSHTKYIKEKYQKLYKSFSKLFVNVEVQFISRKIHDSVYLIRGTENYFSLEMLIDKEERKVLGAQFIMRLLLFFSQILRVNREMRLEIDLRAGTILQKDGAFKLADYNLLFHPNNLKSKRDNLEQELIQKMKYVMFDVLSLKNRKTRDKFAEASKTLLKQLRERRHQAMDQFVEIVEIFFSQGVIMKDQILNFKNKTGASVNQGELMASQMTVSDISVPLLEGENSILGETEIESSNISTAKGTKTNKKKIWMIMFFIVVFLVAVVGGLMYHFLTREIDCGKFYYKQDRKCLSCPPTCYSCVGGGDYNCTYCTNNSWLVLKDPKDKAGRCSTECVGRKQRSTMRCLPIQSFDGVGL